MEVQMKKLFLLSAICIAFVTVAPIIAQDEGGGSSYYYVNVPIERIYPYRKGYVIDYPTSAVLGIARTYIPLEWFEDGPRKETGEVPRGEIILLGSGKSWPYLTVYYKDGAFSHVRIYVRKERSHESWGGIPLNVNLDDKFADVTDLKLTF
jgi:hypothetical protein